MLSRDEIEFLKHHGLSEADVFDTRGRSPASVRQEAKAQGKSILLGVPCAKGGHRLRSRPGHCVQCKPAILGYSARYSKPAQIYIAVSDRLKLIKIGSSEDARQRQVMLNSQSLGGATDWRVVFYADAQEAARLEIATHGALSQHLVPVSYNKGEGRDQISRECFRCSPLLALNTIRATAIKERLSLSGAWMTARQDWSR